MLFFVGGVLFLMLAFQPIYAQAHPLSSMIVSYNYEEQELTVTVARNDDSVTTGYLKEIDVLRNGVQVVNQTYLGPIESHTSTDKFSIAAEDGDVLNITAKFSVSGEISADIVVVEPTTPDRSQLDIALVLIIFLITGIIACCIIAGIKYS
jgi:hypothetical protein